MYRDLKTPGIKSLKNIVLSKFFFKNTYFQLRTNQFTLLTIIKTVSVNN